MQRKSSKHKRKTILQKLFSAPQKEPAPSHHRASLATIRRIPSTPPLPLQAPLSPPALLGLNVTAECDTANIDATRGGEVSVLIRIHGKFTRPPSPDPPGFDAVILLDTALPEPKLALAKRAVKTLIAATTQTSRLGLVVFGRDAKVVSQLTMCTPPYRTDLAASVEDLQGQRRRGVNVFREAMKSVISMLGKDARFGGHVFVVSDGGFDPGSPFWEGCATTIHVVAVGGLVWGERLRGLRQQAGGFVEVRESVEEGWRKGLGELVGYLGGQTYFHSIETVRCRITCPDTHVSLLDINDSVPPTIDSPDQFSLTLRTSPTTTPFNKTPLFGGVELILGRRRDGIRHPNHHNASKMSPLSQRVKPPKSRGLVLQRDLCSETRSDNGHITTRPPNPPHRLPPPRGNRRRSPADAHHKTNARECGKGA